MIKGYKTTLNKINVFFNKKVREVKKANKVWIGNTWLTNPTEKQRAAAVKEVEKERNKYLERLENANKAKKLTFMRIDVNWKRSATWGYNPNAEVWTSGSYYCTGKATGCGYDKESAAVNSALKYSPSLTRFLIENKSKLKDAYGVSVWGGLIQLDISGKGINELLRLFKAVKGWEVCEMHGKTFDGYKIFKK